MAEDAPSILQNISFRGRVRPRLSAETIGMLQALLASSARGPLIWLGLALVIVIGVTAYGQIELNAWNKPFYDALSRRDVDEFLVQLGVFGVIASALLVLNVAQTWLNQMTRMKLREGLTRDLLAQWLAPKRAFMLAGAGEIGVNPDQRIHEDARHLADLTTDLGIGLLQAALLLACFIGVLWSLSGGVTFHFAGKSFVLPGYMVWSALLYAGAASLASWIVGRPLVELNAEHYARESELRFALVHVNEQREGIAVYRGEAEEELRLNANFDSLLSLLRRLVLATTNLTWVTAGYGWFTIVAPVLVAAPAFFAGDLTIGGLFMSVGAFTQVQQSLRWFVDNAGAIADWRATLHRVGALRLALLEIDRMGREASRIDVGASAIDRLVIDDLRVFLPSGCIRLNEPKVEIARGERVLIVGESGSGKTCLFRAMAGLWPWGAGRLTLPREESVLFMPKRPFIPDGTLRDVLAYPSPPEAFTEQQFDAALTRMGLAHLSPALDRDARWDQELSDPEQQGLAFARLLLHQPDCVVVDEAIEALIPAARDAVFDIFAKELASASLLYIGGPHSMPARYTRVLRLVLDPGERRLARLGVAAGGG
ncbi:MAG TPA: ABC transporter ATP-binding protein/permease [Methylocystis sp.]|nr:ABC transporter ATP-binding protein/permease [Methylocystis sp.]